MAVLQGQQNANDPVQPGQHIPYADTQPHRHPAWLTREMPQPTHGFSHHAKTGPIAVRPALPIAADAQHHQRTVQRQQHLPPQTPAFECARAKVFNQHIGLLCQLSHDGLALRCFQVQRHRMLAARLHLPPNGGASEGIKSAAYRSIGNRITPRKLIPLRRVGTILTMMSASMTWRRLARRFTIVAALLGVVEKQISSDDWTASIMHIDVLPEARMGGWAVLLLKAFEQWAKNRNVIEIIFGIKGWEFQPHEPEHGTPNRSHKRACPQSPV